MKRLDVEAKDVRHGDLVHPSSTLADDFEVKAVREIAAGSLVRLTGPLLSGKGRESLAYQPSTLVEVTR